jgi:hypothetical protein
MMVPLICRIAIALAVTLRGSIYLLKITAGMFTFDQAWIVEGVQLLILGQNKAEVEIEYLGMPRERRLNLSERLLLLLLASLL